MDTFFSNIHIRWGADDARFYKDSIDKSGKFHSAESKVRSDMGICLDLSGQGCRSFEEFSEFSWFDLLDRIFKMGGRVNTGKPKDFLYLINMAAVENHSQPVNQEHII